MITRKEYIGAVLETKEERAALHNAYYDQFVTPRIINMVNSYIGEDKIINSTDPHFNDIPLEKWDRLVTGLPVGSKMKEVGDYLTIAGGVCILKAAARQIKEQSENLAK